MREINGVSRQTLAAQSDPAPPYLWDWGPVRVFKATTSTPPLPCAVFLRECQGVAGRGLVGAGVD